MKLETLHSAAAGGWRAELWSNAGKLLYTSPVCATREAAIGLAKSWRNRNVPATKGAAGK